MMRRPTTPTPTPVRSTSRIRVRISQLPVHRGRKRMCPLSSPTSPKVDYKDIKLLQRYISEYGKIIPGRVGGLSAKKQRLLAKMIKRARYLALLPYTQE